MPIDLPPQAKMDAPEMHSNAPEIPQALGAKNENGDYIVTVEESPEQRQRRIEREEKQLKDKATEIVMSYVIREGLFVDKEPEELLNIIQHSALFTNELVPLIKKACEEESGHDTTPTSVSPIVSVRTETDGDTLETVHGLYLQPAVSILSDPEAKKSWKYMYSYDFQDRDAWQRLFPGTEPTLAEQAKADEIMTEAEATASDLREDYKNEKGKLFHPTPERLAKVDLVLQSLGIDPDEYAEANKDLGDLALLLESNPLAPQLIKGDTIRRSALYTLAGHDTSPNDLKNSLEKLQEAKKTFATFKDYFDTVPNEEKGTYDFYLNFKEKFGDENFKALLRVKSATGMGDISEESINSQFKDYAEQAEAREEY